MSLFPVFEQPVHAQQGHAVNTRILFVLDASGSMANNWGRHSTPKMKTAKETLKEIVDSVSTFKHVKTGLRIYGHQSPPTQRDCQDTRLEVGFSRHSASYIRETLDGLDPKGITPIAYSLEQAAGDFPSSKGRNIIILITDGDESCDGDPCEISMELQRKGIVLKNFVIGIGMTDRVEEAFECFDSYYSAKKPGAMKTSLNNILSKVLNMTSLQVRLLDDNGAPTVTNVNMTFQDNHTKATKKNIYHTFNNYGESDTIYLDPVFDYDITAHTLPAVSKNDVELNPNKHNIVDIPAAQGDLNLMLQGNVVNQQLNKKLKCIVSKAGRDKTINVQNFNTKERYLTGKYDLELLTLPRKTIPNVQVKDGQTTDIKIPAPGVANILKPYEVAGALFVVEEKGRLRKIYEMEADKSNETIALQPGSYQLLYRPKYSNNIHSTKMKTFEIASGRSISLHL